LGGAESWLHLALPSQRYTPFDAIKPSVSTGLLGANANESTVSYGLIEVTWNSPDSQNVIAIAGGDGHAVVVWGSGAQTNAHGWGEDTTNGISYKDKWYRL
jgi:hypothetical protein